MANETIAPTEIVIDGDEAFSIGSARLLFVWLVLIVCFVATYAHHRLRRHVGWCPPSVIQIAIGAVAGFFASLVMTDEEVRGLQFNPLTFWFAILPPLLFAAGFNVKKSDFFKNFLPSFLFAVVGTATTAIVFGLLTFALVKMGAIDRSNFGVNALMECLMYGSLIAATDPVPSLAVLENVRVPKLVYNLILGESLLNDPISIELFSTFKKYSRAPYTNFTFFGIVGDFLWISVASIAIGLAVSALGSYILYKARISERDLGRADYTIFEAVVLIGTAYLSYILCDYLELSGIFAIFFSAVLHSHYSFHNMAESSQFVVKKFVDMSASVAETLMFCVLGLSIFCMAHKFDTGLILSGIPLCLIARAFNIFPISVIVNKLREKKIPYRVQLFQWWCGLRGAVAYAMVLNAPLYSNKLGKDRSYIVKDQTNPGVETSVLFTVIMTTLVFGSLSVPVLKALKLEGKTDAEIGVADEPTLPTTVSRRHDNSSAVPGRRTMVLIPVPVDGSVDSESEGDVEEVPLLHETVLASHHSAQRLSGFPSGAPPTPGMEKGTTPVGELSTPGIPPVPSAPNLSRPSSSLTHKKAATGLNQIWNIVDENFIKPKIGGHKKHRRPLTMSEVELNAVIDTMHKLQRLSHTPAPPPHDSSGVNLAQASGSAELSDTEIYAAIRGMNGAPQAGPAPENGNGVLSQGGNALPGRVARLSSTLPAVQEIEMNATSTTGAAAAGASGLNGHRPRASTIRESFSEGDMQPHRGLELDAESSTEGEPESLPTSVPPSSFSSSKDLNSLHQGHQAP